ncbi:MAG TPA: hypothetical protein VG841_05110 [Caulobacterales bacterium]|nr:hypothetical protein [Caulobacterales bacterium]
MRKLILAAALGLAAACATQTPYQPVSQNDRYGYAETPIETNRVRISFSGNSLTERDTVETYLLYRAAEATLQKGYDYFIVATRDTEEHSRLQGVGRPRPLFPYYYYSARHGWAPWYDPFWDEPQSYREITRYQAAAEITMYHGQKPADNPNAYDAHEVQHNLEGRIVRPAAG